MMRRRSLKQRKPILSADSEESWRNSAMAAGLYTCYSANLELVMSGSLETVLFVLYIKHFQKNHLTGSVCVS